MTDYKKNQPMSEDEEFGQESGKKGGQSSDYGAPDQDQTEDTGSMSYDDQNKAGDMEDSK